MVERRDYYERELVKEMGQIFAKNSRERRLRMRLSQQRVAHFMHEIYGFPWHQTMVGKVESGQRAVKMDEAFALCRLYGIELDDLLRGKRLDLIQGGGVLVSVPDGHVHVYPRSAPDDHAEWRTIDSLLQEGQEALEMQIREGHKEAQIRYDVDESGRLVRSEIEARGEHPEA